ncbi:unnamed protein product [Tenebrio molitor]|nr:unnamed protein product [Tenebrio molitor]
MQIFTVALIQDVDTAAQGMKTNMYSLTTIFNRFCRFLLSSTRVE